MRKLPELTHLQFLVVGFLTQRPLSGRDVRERLREFGVRRSGPGFYQLMARLEDAGLVDGSYRQEIVEGQIIRERHYRITPKGSQAWQASRLFYADAIARLSGSEGLAGA
jgi:DNA-binding PadR family transcriptional regulator